MIVHAPLAVTIVTISSSHITVLIGLHSTVSTFIFMYYSPNNIESTIKCLFATYD